MIALQVTIVHKEQSTQRNTLVLLEPTILPQDCMMLMTVSHAQLEAIVRRPVSRSLAVLLVRTILLSGLNLEARSQLGNLCEQLDPEHGLHRMRILM